MELNEQGLKERQPWLEKGYKLPEYDREAVRERTKKHPVWIHFGAGNIFRAFFASVVQNLLNQGIMDRGLIVAEGFDYEIIEKINHTFDDYTLLATLHADGTVDKTVVGSVMESLVLDSHNANDFQRLRKIFATDSLQMASFTITEKGYQIVDGKKEWLRSVKKDFENGPSRPESYMGMVTALLYERYKKGGFPIALVSMDNCSRNGELLYEAVKTFATQWCGKGLTPPEFLQYVQNPDKVSFPWTMIDKITPRPDRLVQQMFEQDGVKHLEPVVTAKNTYVAPFVNAEASQYLVVEDKFPNGRPNLEQEGIWFVHREIVEKVEKMKVCTCLNPLHTALAIFGCLLGYQKISEEMQDDVLQKLVECIGYREGLPMVVDPGIIEPKTFLDTVLQERLPNTFMPDTPQRIATDTSQKLAIRFGETVKAYQSSSAFNVKELKGIPLVFAGWLRYLMGVDDQGEKMILSPDPLLEVISPSFQRISLGEQLPINHPVFEILRNKIIFGVDLFEVGLAEKICQYVNEMIVGVGAVRKTLEKYMND